VRFRDHQERERRIDALEREMAETREWIERELNRADGPEVQRTGLERLRSSIHKFVRSSRTTREEAPQSAEPRPADTSTPPDAGGGTQEATGAPEEGPRRGFFSRLFGG
jgi:hypothetical protein